MEFLLLSAPRSSALKRAHSGEISFRPSVKLSALWSRLNPHKALSQWFCNPCSTLNDA